MKMLGKINLAIYLRRSSRLHICVLLFFTCGEAMGYRTPFCAFIFLALTSTAYMVTLPIELFPLVF